MTAATRDHDETDCKTHEHGKVTRPAGNVRANGRNIAAALSKCDCGFSTDRIVTGAATVHIGGRMAARIGEHTVHGATLAGGSSNVLIGGPSGGATIGNPYAGNGVCKALAAGRASGSTKQSFDNCGIESSRLLIHQSREGTDAPKPLENEMLMEQVHRQVDRQRRGPTKPCQWRGTRGGTLPEERVAILERWGVGAELAHQDLETIAHATSDGNGVITAHDAGVLWDDSNYNGSGHAVTVIGMDYDENGQPKTVIVADTGTGNCHAEIPADRFARSLKPGKKAVVTKEPIWRR